jgi:hypothetical protein
MLMCSDQNNLNDSELMLKSRSSVLIFVVLLLLIINNNICMLILHVDEEPDIKQRTSNPSPLYG